ncbi:MAG: metal-dependent transcriptional regulator [Bacteroidota bacterium]
MKRQSETKENYLKAILHYSPEGENVSNNTIAKHLGTSPASVTDMVKKLQADQMLTHESYKGVKLTEAGRKIALQIIRKHRLWELFLVETLGFTWDNVHEVAEQLEHVNSPELINRIDEFLNFPRFDPHGDPIPNAAGEIVKRNTQLLTEVSPPKWVEVVGVSDSDPDFLQYLDSIGLALHQRIKVVEKLAYDQSCQLEIDGQRILIGGNAARNIRVLVE